MFRPNVKYHAVKKLLGDFTNKVFSDFVVSAVNAFELPVGLWIYNENEKLIFFQASNGITYLPEFCKFIKANFTTPTSESICSIRDSDTLKRYLNDLYSGRKKISNGFSVERCHIGIYRIVFPIKMGEEYIGVLTVGKFIQNKLLDLEEIQKKNKDLLSISPIENSKSFSFQEANKLIKNLPIFDKNDILRVANEAKKLIPLISGICQYGSFKGKHLQSIIFLDDLERIFPDIIVTEDELWNSAKKYISRILEKLNLKSAVIFYNSMGLSTEFEPKVILPDRQQKLEPLLLASSDEVLWIANRKRGIILPRKKEELSWINQEYLATYFQNIDSILYSSRVYDEKVVLIGFGFKPEKILSHPERILLRKSIERLFKFINNTLANIETDQIMNATGHLLRRAVAKIEGGVEDIGDYGLVKKKNDTPEIIIARKAAFPAIRNGLFRLDLIIRNFKAFQNLREASLAKKSSQICTKIERIDVIKLINKSIYLFNDDMNINQKSFKFKILIKEWYEKPNPSLFQLMILNIFDNAEKFSYRGTYIDIKIYYRDGFNILEVCNLGVGIADSETNLVFNKYYQSVYNSTSKRRKGTGLGLNFCKKYMELFFPEGNITISSRANETREESFAGDNYLTCCRVKFPKGTN